MRCRSARAALVCVVLMLVVSAACSPGTAGTSGAVPGTAAVHQLHLTWPTDPEHTVAIQWITAASRTSDVIIRAGNRGAFRRIANHRSSHLLTTSGQWHTTPVSGLRPATHYEYAVRTNSGWSKPFRFTTAPRSGAPVRIDVFADQGDCQSFAAACRVIAGIAADRPAVVLAAGDLSYGTEHGLAADDRWSDNIEPWSTSAPIAPAWGNHEADYPNVDPLAGFKRRFALPGKKDWYSFDVGDVHVLTLPERYVPVSAGTPYHHFLVSDLTAATYDANIHWIIAFGHRPTYSTGTRHGSEARYQRNLVQLFDRFGVNLVIGGHEHNYERTVPLRAGAPAADGHGTTYVVTGGGGADIYDDFSPAAPWDAARAVTHEHLRIDTTPTTLHLVAVADNGATVDDVTLTR